MHRHAGSQPQPPFGTHVGPALRRRSPSPITDLVHRPETCFERGYTDARPVRPVLASGRGSQREGGASNAA
jgi:hypothetical protein